MGIWEKLKSLSPSLVIDDNVEVKARQLFDVGHKLDRDDRQASTASLANQKDTGQKVVLGLLDGGRTDALLSAASRESMEHAKQQVRRQGIEVARQELRELHPARMRVRSDEYSAKASEKESELKRLREEIQPLLDQLEEKDGVLYVPKRPASYHNDVYVDREVYYMPKTEILQAEVDELRQKAFQILNQKFVDSGRTNTSTTDDLGQEGNWATLIDNLQELAWCNDLGKMGPPAYALRDWARSAYERVKLSYQPTLNNRPVKIRHEFIVTWRDGVLIESESQVRAVVTDEYVDVPQVAA